MGKKNRRTKWTSLPIVTTGREDGEGVAVAAAAAVVAGDHQERHFHSHHHHPHQPFRKPPPTSLSPSGQEERQVIVNEDDEYTKIITPRQDVLFKKRYLTRRRALIMNGGEEIRPNECRGEERHFLQRNGEETQQNYMCQPPYMDPSALYYAGNSYEIFDPYTGNVTVLVGPPVPQPGHQYGPNGNVMPNGPCRPVPLQPLQWFNPVPNGEWCCNTPYSNPKGYPPNSQNNYSAVSSESSGVPESPPEMSEDHNNVNSPPLMPSNNGYVYPGYMFGAPIYNVDGVNVQYCTSHVPPQQNNDQTSPNTSARKRKKKKRRKREETGEESEVSSEERFNISPEYEGEGQLQIQQQQQQPSQPGVISFEQSSLRRQSVIEAREFVPQYASQVETANKNQGEVGEGTTVDYDKSYEKKRDVVSSSNSDSGISSPGSEDARSKELFEEAGAKKAAEGGEKGKRARAKKGKGNKEEEGNKEAVKSVEIKGKDKPKADKSGDKSGKKVVKGQKDNIKKSNGGCGGRKKSQEFVIPDFVIPSQCKFSDNKGGGVVFGKGGKKGKNAAGNKKKALANKGISKGGTGSSKVGEGGGMRGGKKAAATEAKVELTTTEDEEDATFSKYVSGVPQAPPRRRRKAVEKEARRLVEDILEEAGRKIAERREDMPITEAVTKWLTQQEGGVLVVPRGLQEKSFVVPHNTDASEQEDEGDDDYDDDDHHEDGEVFSQETSASKDVTKCVIC